MAWNGSGTYTRTNGTFSGSNVWANDRDAGTKIRADNHDTHDADLATGINACLTKNGENAATADLPMGGNKHTNVDDGTARNHYAAAGQVQDSAFIWCGTAGGSKNALTLTPTPAIAAYAAGQEFVFQAGSTASDDAVTIAVSGLTAKAGEMDDAAFSASVVIEANKYYKALYDGTAFQVSRLSRNAIPVSAIGSTVQAYDADTTKNDVANTFTATQAFSKGADVASASPLVLGTDGNYFDVTGTTGFSAITVAAGTLFMLQFDGALTITHGSGITLPGAANITTVAGDRLIGFATAANTVDVLAYTRASGKAVVAPLSASYTSTGQTITSAGALTLAHGLGAVPKIIQARLVCGTTDLGYSVSDEVCVDFGPLANDSSRGVSVVPDATNLNIRFGSDSSAFSLLNKGTGGVGNITNSSWTIKFLAFV